MKKKLIGMDIDEIREMISAYSLPGYASAQVAEWIYKKRVREIDDMTNLSKKARDIISEQYEMGITNYTDYRQSIDGTRKYLFPTSFDRGVEAVTIPDQERMTVCISSQAGCKMACDFCMTGRGGFKGNLDAGEILSQILAVDEAENIDNIVFMGMGEPLDNYNEVIKAINIITADWGFGFSPKRITLSTIGLLPQVDCFLKESKAHLAVSMHNPFGSERVRLMPMEKAFPIEEVVETIRRYDFSGQRRVSFEYIMFDGVNDSKRHADGVIRMLRGIECRVNLIRYHKIPGSGLKPAPVKVIENFQERLNRAGIVTTIRKSKGEDIMAACGMLSGKTQ